MQDLSFALHNHGSVIQEGHTGDMVFDVDALIAEVSQFMTLKVGDLMFTGTPAGVGPVAPGDRLVGVLEGEEMFAVNVK